MSQQLFPRVKTRIQLRPMGIISGLIGGLGMVVLLQQFAVLIPTRNVLIAGPLIGVAATIVLNTLGRALGARRLNKMLGQAEEVVRQKEVASPGEVLEDGWTPTHVVPAGGLESWQSPDSSGPSTPIEEGLQVQVVEEQGDWSRVTFSNGWSAWVDGRTLVKS